MAPLTEQMCRGKTRMERLDQILNLNLWGQDLDDVSVLQNLTNVEVLSLSVNRIATLRDFRHCTLLRELYLRKNEVMDVSDIMFLVPLKQLKVLWLCDNPCADHPLYRQLVARALPSVESLDNADITPQERDAATRNPELSRFFLSPPNENRPISRPPPPQQQQPPPQPRVSPSPARGTPNGAAPDRQLSGPPRSRKNILYAVMALLTELDDEDLHYIKREIEQRVGGGMGSGR